MTFRAKILKVELFAKSCTFRLFGQFCEFSTFRAKIQKVALFAQICTFRLFGQKFKKSHFSQKFALFDFSGKIALFDFSGKNSKRRTFRKRLHFSTFISPLPARNIGYGICPPSAADIGYGNIGYCPTSVSIPLSSPKYRIWGIWDVAPRQFLSSSPFSRR